MPRSADGQDGSRIAVIIPCFNDGPLLMEAVASVEERESIQLIVIDDCSTDAETGEIVARLRSNGVTVVRHESNRGLSEARNTGLAATSAPYVFPLDADDLAIAGALARMADRLDRNREAAVCYGDYLEFGTHELVRAVPPTLDPFRVALVNEYPVSALHRRAVIDEVGGWETIGAGYEDWDLWMTLAERMEKAAYLGAGALTFRKRFHGARMLTNAKRQHSALYRTLRDRHPRLFADLNRHRRASNLSAARKLLYPLVYGGRRRFAFERHVKTALDRTDVWTLRR